MSLGMPGGPAMTDMMPPPPFFGIDHTRDDSSDDSSNNFPLTSLESSLLLMEQSAATWEDEVDTPPTPPPTQHSSSRTTTEQFPSPTQPFTGTQNQPLNHFVSIAFSPHQLTHLPQSPTPVEALQLTPSSLYPYTVLPGHTGGQDGRVPDQTRKYVRRLLSTSKPKPMQQNKKIVRTIMQSSNKSSVGSSPGGAVDIQSQDQDPPPVKRRFCHVCRSAKEVSKVVVCSSGKQSHVFCSSCVRRRLGLDFEQLLQQTDWICPKCNDQCPCSKCRKK